MKKLFSSIILSILFVSMVFCQTPTTKNINTMSQTNINTNPTGKIPVTTGTNQTGYTTPQAISDFVNSNIVSPNYVSNSRLNDSLTAIKNTMNGIITANFGNVAYVSKSGNNSTAIIGDKNRPFKDPVTAKNAIVSANIQNGLIEVFSACYMYADTDTAVWQMSQRGFNGTIDVFTEVPKTATNSAISLSFNGSYYLHAGVRICSGRFWDSTALALFYDTTGVSTRVYGKGSIEDYGTYLKSNTLPNMLGNTNYQYHGGRIFMLRKDAQVYLEGAKIHTHTFGLYQFGGTNQIANFDRFSAASLTAGQRDTNFSTVWTPIDSLTRNWNFKGLNIAVDSSTGNNFFLNMNYSNWAMLSDRGKTTRGNINVYVKNVNVTGGGWSGLESFNNYNIDVQFGNTIKMQSPDLVDIRNCTVVWDYGKVFNQINGSAYGWWAGVFENSTFHYKSQNMICTHPAYLGQTKLIKTKIILESPNHVQNGNTGWGATHEAHSFAVIGGSYYPNDTTTQIWIKNTNFKTYSAGALQQAPIDVRSFNHWMGATTSNHRVFIQNSTFYTKGQSAPLVEYYKWDANSPSNLNIYCQNVIMFGGGTSVSTNSGQPATIQFPLETPQVSSFTLD